MLTQKSLIFEPACALYLYISGICLMLLESIPEIIKDVLWGFKTGCYDTGSFYRVPWCLAILKQQTNKIKENVFPEICPGARGTTWQSFRGHFSYVFASEILQHKCQGKSFLLFMMWKVMLLHPPKQESNFSMIIEG